MGVRALPSDTTEVVLDFDASDDPLHWPPGGALFSRLLRGVLLPAAVLFCRRGVLWAQLRPSDIDASEGTVEALEKIVAAMRRRFPQVRIIVRGDSGFCREALMAWCERQAEVYDCLGLARNARLTALLAPALERARQQQILCGGASVARLCRTDLRDALDLEPRAPPRPPTSLPIPLLLLVIGKAEVTAQGDNPRFVVTSLPADACREPPEGAGRFAAAPLYEDLYCGRGEMENRIKQMQLDLAATRMSTHWMASNQLRLWLTAFGYLLLERLRALSLEGTELARASLGTIRLRLLKVAAQVHVSVRRVQVRLASAYPLQPLFANCHARLMRLATAAG